jgi:elongation factor P--(R)-beta-lysine ligase
MMQTLWQPGANPEILHRRAQLYARIRCFFATRHILEVETPILASTCAPEMGIHPFITHYHGVNARPLYLQSSPELAMKRLLAAGSGAIFQLTRAFRDAEVGRWHNPEFTILEWYRPDFNQDLLMDDVEAFFCEVAEFPPAHRCSYRALFQQALAFDPLEISLSELQACVYQKTAYHDAAHTDRDTCLQLLMSHCIEPSLGFDAPVMVYDFPASQAALARLNPHDPQVAERFEVYFKGVELANAFHELTDPVEQRRRFEKEISFKNQENSPYSPLDERFFAALEAGLPDCAGVAIGIDRLLMLLTNSKTLDDVLAFSIQRI